MNLELSMAVAEVKSSRESEPSLSYDHKRECNSEQIAEKSTAVPADSQILPCNLFAQKPLPIHYLRPLRRAEASSHPALRLRQRSLPFALACEEGLRVGMQMMLGVEAVMLCCDSEGKCELGMRHGLWKDYRKYQL